MQSFFQQKATVYAQTVELKTRKVQGFDFSPLDMCRWRPTPQPIRLSDQHFHPVSEVFKVFEFDLQHWNSAPIARTVLIPVTLWKDTEAEEMFAMQWFTGLTCNLMKRQTSQHLLIPKFHLALGCSLWNTLLQSEFTKTRHSGVFVSHDSSTIHFELESGMYNLEENQRPSLKYDEQWFEETRKMERFSSFLFQTIKTNSELLNIILIMASQSGSFGLDPETCNEFVNKMIHSLHLE